MRAFDRKQFFCINWWRTQYLSLLILIDLYFKVTFYVYLPSRLSTLTGTKTDGTGWFLETPTCCNGGTVEQYSIGLFGLGCLIVADFCLTRETEIRKYHWNLKKN